MGDWIGDIVQPIFGSKGPTRARIEAQDRATQAQTDLANRQMAESQRVYDASAPYRNLGVPASYMLQSLLSGSPVNGIAPNWSLMTNGTYKNDVTGEVANKAPSQMYSFDIMNNPLLKAITQPAIASYNSALASRGLLGSGQAARGMADINLAAVPQAYSMLLDPIKISTGASSSAGSTMLNSNANANALNANAIQTGANNKNSIYDSRNAGMYNDAGLGIKGYDWGKSNGWWGGSDYGTLGSNDMSLSNATMDQATTSGASSWWPF